MTLLCSELAWQRSILRKGGGIVFMKRSEESLKGDVGWWPLTNSASQTCTLRRVCVSVCVSYLAGLFRLWFDADEDVKLLHERCDALRLHFNVLFNVEH